MSVVMTVNLQRAARGQDIIDAVKRCFNGSPGEYYEEKDHVDEQVLFTIGRNSKHPYKDAVISVGGDAHQETKIDPDGLYDKVAIVHHEWPGMKYAVGYSDDSIVSAAKEFRDSLQVELS